MKTKFQKVLAISLIAIMLCSCATKEKDNFDSASNPFDASAQENMPPDSDKVSDRRCKCGFFQNGRQRYFRI